MIFYTLKNCDIWRQLILKKIIITASIHKAICSLNKKNVTLILIINNTDMQCTEHEPKSLASINFRYTLYALLLCI